MKSDNGRDNLTLENYSIEQYNAENTEWVFQLYGTAEAGKKGQTFHEDHQDSNLHGQTPTTMVAEPND